MACGGMIFTKKSLFFIQNFFHFSFFFLHITFSRYYCFIDLKRQSEHSGFCPDTSSLVLLHALFVKLKLFIIANQTVQIRAQADTWTDNFNEC